MNKAKMSELRDLAELAPGYYLTCLLRGCVFLAVKRKGYTVLWLDMIRVHDVQKQGTGLGSAALQDLTDLADEWGWTILLSAEPMRNCPMGKRDLMRWYRRHGFKTKGSPHMIRRPR